MVMRPKPVGEPLCKLLVLSVGSRRLPGISTYHQNRAIRKLVREEPAARYPAVADDPFINQLIQLQRIAGHRIDVADDLFPIWSDQQINLGIRIDTIG